MTSSLRNTGLSGMLLMSRMAFGVTKYPARRICLLLHTPRVDGGYVHHYRPS